MIEQLFGVAGDVPRARPTVHVPADKLQVMSALCIPFDLSRPVPGPHELTFTMADCCIHGSFSLFPFPFCGSKDDVSTMQAVTNMS